MPLALENPSYLTLLLLLPLLYLLGRDRLSLMSPWRRRTVLTARLVSVCAVILALAGLSMPIRDATMSVAFMVDSSESISPETRAQEEEWVREAVARMHANDQAAVVAFAGDAKVVKPLGGERQIQLSPAGELSKGTDISTALKTASGILPASGLRKVVLLSDGWDTSGGVMDAVRSLPSGTRVDVVPWPPLEGRPEVLVESMELPAYIREGDGFDLSAVIDTNHEGPAHLQSMVDGQESGSWTVELGQGANLVTMPQKALPLGFHKVEVLLSAQADTVAENNRAAGTVVVKPRASVLLVEGHPEGSSGALRRELEGSGLRVSQISPPQLPIQMPILMGFDAVVLDDVAGPSLSLDQIKTLQSYVRDQGRGLLVVGGGSSYGLGDYVGYPLEEILPVSSEAPLSRERGDMALVLVVDRSGSMDDSSSGASKIAMAREAAIQATSALKPNDQIAVVAFDIDPNLIVPPQRVGSNLDSIRARISSLQASGGTDIYSALQMAYDTISGMTATTRHITLLTDGQSWKGQYKDLIQKMNDGKITLSTVAIGSDADQQWLSEMASLGQGRYYFTERASDIPRIVYREVAAATRVAEVNGRVNPQLVAPSPILRGMSRNDMPPLTGYVATKPKSAATVVLESGNGDPILAQWQYGLGRVVSWTSDGQGMWSADWISSPSFSRVFDQAVRWSMAPPVNHALQLSARIDGGHVTLTVDSVDRDGRFVDLADTQGTITAPDGTSQTLRLRQTAPGRYQGTFPVSLPGAYRVDVEQSRDGVSLGEETGGFAVPPSPEFRSLGSNDALLKEVAAMTGGTSTHDQAQVFSRSGMPTSPGWEPLWPYLLAASMLILPIEIALRRIRSLPFSQQGPEEVGHPSPLDTPAAAEERDREGLAA